MLSRKTLQFVLLVSALFPATGDSLVVNSTDIAGCPSFSCGPGGPEIAYPFWVGDTPAINTSSAFCGYPDFKLTCINATAILNVSGDDYAVTGINYRTNTFHITNAEAVLDATDQCPRSLRNFTAKARYLFSYTAADANLTFFLNCSGGPGASGGGDHVECLDSGGNRSYVFLDAPDPGAKLGCGEVVKVPVLREMVERVNVSALRELVGEIVRSGFFLSWAPAGEPRCRDCETSGGRCGYGSSGAGEPDFVCFCINGLQKSRCNLTVTDLKEKRSIGKIIIGVAGGVGGFLIVCCASIFLYMRRRKRNQSATSLIDRSSSFDSSSKKDPEHGSVYQTQTFTYGELQEATDNFSQAKELGDGGFGTVYKGKLRDGRTVAVKRLYQNNCKRMEQFMNEIEILSRLRHQNLVTLYGCSSCHAHELLLVYEFVSNGTVADHLHGVRVGERALTWHIRMNIAIETADALAYLHAVEPQIIHRDVKTNNILLDNSFHVKVADFGLSRLFPADATHVSTAPQGTPGYVDPEYHQCYQLTDKSDVYSYGVVLVELISSKPAVDVNRHRPEINLANMAINRIQNSELDQLIDRGLGYDSDDDVKAKITQVAELAFRCLQADREMRPHIKEVLETLKAIQSGSNRTAENPLVAECDGNNTNDVPLLKDSLHNSPDSVTDKWVSRTSTPNTSN